MNTPPGHDAEYERMKDAIEAGDQMLQSPVMSVAQMRPPLADAGVLLRRWLDEQRETEGGDNETEDEMMTDGLPVTAENQHHDYVNAESTRLAIVAALDYWEKAGCDCCAPTILDHAIDRIGYEVAYWERMRRFGIELAQTAQNVIDGEADA